MLAPSQTRPALIGALLLAGGIAGATARDQLGRIMGAGKHLDAAALSLNEATEDFDGHKKKALELIAEAKKELDQATTWAKTH